MSVIVKGMEMPEHCYDCPLQDGETGRCNILGITVYDIPKECPLIELVRCEDCVHYENGFCYNPNTYDDEKTRGKVFDTCLFLKQEVNGNVERGGKPNGCPLIDVPDTNAGDLISRKAAIDAMERAKERYFDRKEIIRIMQDIVNNLPSAQVERKRGKWVRKEIHSNWSDWTEDTCSLCGTTFKGLYKAKYCPNCGAEMGGSDGEIH